MMLTVLVLHAHRGQAADCSCPGVYASCTSPTNQQTLATHRLDNSLKCSYWSLNRSLIMTEVRFKLYSDFDLDSHGWTNVDCPQDAVTSGLGYFAVSFEVLRSTCEELGGLV